VSRRKFNVWRDGYVHVKARMCKTCIYRKDSPLYDVAIKAEAMALGTGVICHSTLLTRPRANAVCAGFMAHDRTPALRLAEAMGLVRKVK